MNPISATTNESVSSTNDLMIRGNVSQGGFRPELFIVPSGSFASNSSFGAGTPGTGTYNPNEVPTGQTITGAAGPENAQTTAKVRQQDSDATFDIVVTLNAESAIPLVTGEVRLRVLSPITNSIGGVTSASFCPSRLAVGLPLPDVNFGLPIFNNVEFLGLVGTTWQPVLPTTVNSQATAQMLNDGTIALTITTFTTGPMTVAALTTTSLDALLGQVSPGFIKVSIRGSYRAAWSGKLA